MKSLRLFSIVVALVLMASCLRKEPLTVPVSSVELSAESLRLRTGESGSLSVVINPDEATDKTVIWSTSDESVATVSNGNVTAVKVGTADIIATSGDKADTCTVTVSAPIAEAVDLGLSVKWASWNIGASKPEEYGDYYAWGETAAKSEYSWTTYKWRRDDDSLISKYCNIAGYGTADNKFTLEMSDDVARQDWEGEWRIPTMKEVLELQDYCSWTWTTLNGVNGYEVTGKKTGYTDKSIFLPAAGYLQSTDINDIGVKGFYWISSVDENDPFCAYSLQLRSFLVVAGDCYRQYGISVRPVSK